MEDKKSTKVEKKDLFSKYTDVLTKSVKNMLPIQDDNVKLTLNGELCFTTKEGNAILISKEGELTEYMEELCCDIPAFSICRPKNEIRVGDYIKYKETYCRVIKIVERGLKVVTTSGSEVIKKNVKDFFMGTPTFRVIVSPFSMTPGMNPMMLMALDGKKSLDDIIAMSMFGGGNTDMRMLFAMKMFEKDDKSDKEDSLTKLMKFSMMSQCMGNTFSNNNNNMFGGLGNMFEGLGNMFGGMFKANSQTSEKTATREESITNEEPTSINDDTIKTE